MKNTSGQLWAVIQPDDMLLKRKFSDWSDVDVRREVRCASWDLKLLQAEANRRGLIKKPSGAINSLEELYGYLIGQEFIITRERRSSNGQTESYGRPNTGVVTEVDADKRKFKIRTHDYDENVDYECEYSLPRWVDTCFPEKGNVVFNVVTEHKGFDSITKFWEKQ